MNLLSFPFRLTIDGHIAEVEQGSDGHRAELLAELMLTRIGERPLAPDFGLLDMVGRGLDEAELAAAVGMFFPDISLTDIQIESVAQDIQQVTVTFQ